MLKDIEIKSAIELFVNSIYNGESDWLEAEKGDWIDAVWEELSNWKEDKRGCRKSPVNRFEGKANTLQRISDLLDRRFEALKDEGYPVPVFCGGY